MSNTEPPEHYERMVKEKPVFNPNLAEEMRTVKTEPAQHIPCSTETLTASCTLCGKPFTVGHACLIDPLQPIQPNRFDPYEALDTILDALRDLSLGPRHSVNNRISRKIYALRAYITGMEK